MINTELPMLKRKYKKDYAVYSLNVIDSRATMLGPKASQPDFESFYHDDEDKDFDDLSGSDIAFRYITTSACLGKAKDKIHIAYTKTKKRSFCLGKAKLSTSRLTSEAIETTSEDVYEGTVAEFSRQYYWKTPWGSKNKPLPKNSLLPDIGYLFEWGWSLSLFQQTSSKYTNVNNLSFSVTDYSNGYETYQQQDSGFDSNKWHLGQEFFWGFGWSFFWQRDDYSLRVSTFNRHSYQSLPNISGRYFSGGARVDVYIPVKKD